LNLLLLRSSELNGSRVVISDHRASHILNVIKPETEYRLKAGVVNGAVGSAVVKGFSDSLVELEFLPEREPPEPLGISLVLALPRPKVFRRVLFAAVSAGVKDISVINSWRVEKSYWKSPYLSEESVEKICLEALSQAKDTLLPEVSFYRFFMDFINEGVKLIPDGIKRFIAHPYAELCAETPAPAVIAVGPEGGFVDREVETFQDCGFCSFSVGDRILTTEHFVPFVLGRFAG